MLPTLRGALIVIEGLDRAGKSTQHDRICEHLKSSGHRVKQIRFPDRSTSIGSSISSYLNGSANLEDHAIHLLFSANRWEAAPSIIDAIASGTIVVVDRYYYSGIVYTAAKHESGLGLQWCKAPDVGLPRPDQVIFLDIDLETAKKRGGFGDERYERDEMQQTVKNLFHEVIEMEEKTDRITRIVDASKSLDDVTDVLKSIVGDVLKNPKLNEPLQRIAS